MSRWRASMPHFAAIRHEIRGLHQRLGVPMIFVTHDAGEAMALGRGSRSSATAACNRRPIRKRFMTGPPIALSPRCWQSGHELP